MRSSYPPNADPNGSLTMLTLTAGTSVRSSDPRTRLTSSARLRSPPAAQPRAQVVGRHGGRARWEQQQHVGRARHVLNVEDAVAVGVAVEGAAAQRAVAARRPRALGGKGARARAPFPSARRLASLR